MKYLVTGAAGFIGFHVSKRLLEAGHQVVGIDNLNDYYDVSLKQARLALLVHPGFHFHKIDLADREGMASLFASEHFERVIHLAAQAGVRYSLENPHAYADSNLTGFLNILEGCRHNKIQHLLYASSSSVYGLNRKMPFSTDDSVDHPVSLYAATKKANELMAHTYSHLYGLPTTGLRFFTVYGPWGRPDMALFKFTKAMLEGKSIDVYNYGKMKRDFTYIDDIVEGVSKVMCAAPERRNGADGLPVPPYAIYNIGNSHPENLLDFVRILSEELVSAGVLPEDYNFEEHNELVPMQPGDVPVTYADTSALEEDFGFKPNTTLREGLRRFPVWYKDFYMTEGK